VQLDIKIVRRRRVHRVVQDDIDTGLDGNVVFTPALTRRLTRCFVSFTWSALRLDRHAQSVAVVEREIEGALPKGIPVIFDVASLTEAKAERAIEPESIALAVFGAIAGIAALLIAAQVISRLLRAGADDLETLRALGAGRTTTTADGLLGVLVAVLGGSLLAVAVAVALSPLSPLGTVRFVYPHRGIAFDWTVLGLGVIFLTGALSGVALIVAYRRAPRGGSAPLSPVERSTRRRGVRAARVRGRGDPVRGRPRTGPNLGTGALGDLRGGARHGGRRRDGDLRREPRHTGFASRAVRVELDLRTQRGEPDVRRRVAGQGAARPRSRGRRVDRHLLRHARHRWPHRARDRRHAQRADRAARPLRPRPNDAEIVLGAATLDDLHRHVGDTVVVQGAGHPPVRLRIAGTATLPALGINASLHTEMGTGAYLASTWLSEGAPASSGGPNEVLVRLRSGANAATERRKLQQLVPAANGGEVSAVQRPAEIVNYRTMGRTPALLGIALAVGAFVALGLTLYASVRRRRRELALLKTLGFTRRQLAATVAWQASVAVVLGIVVGVPLGAITGRLLWDQFANALHVVSEPTVPALTVVLIALGAVVLANVVAAVPGRAAARTRTAEVLRSE
jgi:hypothetical protein